MYARSAAFDVALRNSHVVVTSAELLLGGSVVRSNLPILGGGVDVDIDADIRRRCGVSLVDDDGTLTPNDQTDDLSPYGREIRLYSGVRYVDGTEETVPLGTFRIARAVPSISARGRTIALNGFDRARSVQRARFEVPYTIASGTNYATAIRSLVDSRVPGLTFNFVSTTSVTPLLVFSQGEDPWKKAQEMARAIGCELFFDPLGVCTLVPASDPSVLPVVWDYGEGSSATVLTVENALDDTPGYNGVVVDGEPPDADPVHVAVYDSDTSSPTYYLGSYGKVPRFYRSQFIKTTSQATAVANAMLLAEKGGTEQVKISAIPQPAHEVGDVVRIADEALGIDSNYVLESFALPLGLGTMTATTRKRRTA